MLGFSGMHALASFSATYAVKLCSEVASGCVEPVGFPCEDVFKYDAKLALLAGTPAS